MLFTFVSKTGDRSFTFEDILALITFTRDAEGRSFYSRYEEGSELTEVLLYDFLKSSLGLVPAYFEEFYVLVNAVICALDKGDPSPWIRAELPEETLAPDWTQELKLQAEARNYRRDRKPEVIYLTGKELADKPAVSRITHATAFYLRFYSQDPLPTL
jgi:hypothetical protein